MTSFAKIAAKNFIIYSLILLLFLAISSPFIINLAVNTSYIKNQISLAISEKTGSNFNSSRFSITFFPNLGVSVEDFIISPDKKTDITIKRINFNLDIKKLLSGKISVTDISIIRPELKAKPSDQSKSPTNAYFSNLKTLPQLTAAIKNLFVLLPEHQDAALFEFKDVRTPYFKRMDGSFYLSKKLNQIIINTTIDNISLKLSEIFNSDFRQYSDMDMVELRRIHCKIELNSKGTINGECRFSNFKLQSKTSQLLSDIDHIESSFKISEDICKIDIKPFKLNFPEAVVEISFQEDQLQEKSWLQIRGRDINVSQAKQVSAVMFKNSEISGDLFNILNKGVVPEVDISFTGKNFDTLFNAGNLILEGVVEKALVHIPETDLKASAVDGNATLEKGVLSINIQKGVINGSKIKKGSLDVDLLNYIDFPFKGEFLLDIDLAMIPETLISLLPQNRFTRELQQVHSVTGSAETKLKLSMETRSDDLKVGCSTSDFSIKGLYDRIPGDIDLNSINFIYEPDMVHLKNISGVINNITVDDLELSLDFKDEAKINVISGSGVIDLESAMPWIDSLNIKEKLFPGVEQIHGKIYVHAMNISGYLLNMDSWRYNAAGKCEDVDFFSQLDQKIAENMSCSYQISDEFINLDKLNLKINNLSPIQNFISKDYLKSIMLPIDMNKGTLQYTPEKKKLKCDLNFKPGPTVNIQVKGETLESLHLESVRLYDKNISDGTFFFNHDPGEQDKFLFDFTGFLNSDTLMKIIKPDCDWAERLNTMTEGRPIIISINKNSNLHIKGKSINLNSMAGPTQKISFNTQLLPGNSKTIIFKTDLLKIKDFTFKNFDSTIFLKKEGLYIRLHKAFLCDLETSSGYINSSNNIINFKLPVKADNNKDIQDLLTCLFHKKKFMDGKYSLKCNLFSKTDKKEYLNKINGSLEFLAENGHIYKLTLLSRILSVINVSKIFKGRLPDITQDGFRYKTVVIEASIKESKIYLKKAVIDGEDMTFVFTGVIDPLKDNLNLTCLVAPFKTVDLIVEKIPILNTMLDGRLVSLPVKASGKLSDPTVVPLHPSAVGTTLFNMITTILKTPVKLLEKIDGN